MSVEIDPPARLGETEVRGGRLLGWAEWGPPDGTPVLLIPGAATSRWLGVRAGAAESLGVRLVSIDRPGLGVSTPLPGLTFADLATDLDVFTHARGFPRPPVLANSQGEPFALACAAETIASGADKIASPRWSIWRVPIPREPKPCSGSSTPRRCGGW